jgi:hypothetical protein
MDTRETELKEGAAADLLQQEPHVEVADSGTSAVSSDEEIGCRHLNDWTASQGTLWSTAEKAH